MKSIIVVAIVGVLLSIVLAAFEQLGIGTQLRDRKGRFLSVLGVTFIGAVCALAITYIYLVGSLWLLLVLSPLIVALGVAGGIFLVGRILPNKISNRQE